jgi:hypothetical protein
MCSSQSQHPVMFRHYPLSSYDLTIGITLARVVYDGTFKSHAGTRLFFVLAQLAS